VAHRREVAINAVHEIEEVVVSEDQLRGEQQQLAAEQGVTVGELYRRMEVGEYRSTILEAKLSMLRFLLGEGSEVGR
jgi:hypothetical protein